MNGNNATDILTLMFDGLWHVDAMVNVPTTWIRSSRFNWIFIYLFIYKLKLAASYELYTTHKKRVMKLKSIGSRSTSSRVSRRQHSTSETNREPKRNARFGPHQTLPSASCVTWHPASAKVRQYRNGSRKWCCIESSGNPPVTALLPIDTSVPWTSPTWWYWSDLVLLQHR